MRRRGEENTRRREYEDQTIGKYKYTTKGGEEKERRISEEEKTRRKEGGKGRG